MKKLDRQLISLKDGIPQTITIEGGFDIYITEFRFEYNSLNRGKAIALAFIDSIGTKLSQHIGFDDEGYTTFLFTDNEVIKTYTQPGAFARNFVSIELHSKVDVTFGIKAQEMEVA
jgi:hypothetical protein